MHEQKVDKGDIGFPRSPDNSIRNLERVKHLLESLEPDELKKLYSLLGIKSDILTSTRIEDTNKKDFLIDNIRAGDSSVLGIDSGKLVSIHLPLLRIFQNCGSSIHQERVSRIKPSDLTVFSGLRSINLWAGTADDYSPLLQLKDLKQLSVGTVVTDEQRDALDRLEKRGVKISMQVRQT